MKRNLLFLAVSLLLMLSTRAQSVAINTDGSLPNPNAILDVKSGTKGILIPRMDSAARKAIPNTKGLLVYDTTTSSFWYNTGAQWQNIAAASATAVADSAWLLTGNSGTADSINFLGTLDNVPLNIRVNNQPAGRIDHINGNAFWGYRSGLSNTTGNNITAIGTGALQNNSTGKYNTAGGYQALFTNSTGEQNTAHGYQSLYSNTTGYYNSATGTNSLFSNTTGYANTSNGLGSLYSNTTGINNSATGLDALHSNTTGQNNTANGTQALYSTTTLSGLTATGYEAMYSNTSGTGNTANGYQALYSNDHGFQNTAMGYQSMYAATGQVNTAVGYQSLYNTQNGSNTAVGSMALYANTQGAGNTGVGAFALMTNNFGFSNTAIGSNADVSTGILSNATAIGSGAIADASNKVRIGNAAVTVIEGQVPFTTPSDGRYKYHVQEDVKGLDFILHLRPVTYQFDVKRFDEQMNHQSGNANSTQNYALQAAYTEASQIRRSGFIAQEVEKAANASGYDFSGIIKPKTEEDHYSLSYDAFVVPLVKAVQEQQKLIDDQNKKMDEQDKKIAALQQQVEEIKKLIQH